MDKTELNLMLMRARAVLAEGTLVFLWGKLSEGALGACAEQIAPFRDRLARAIEEIALLVERDLLASQGRTEHERALLAEEFRALLEELQRKLGA